MQTTSFLGAAALSTSSIFRYSIIIRGMFVEFATGFDKRIHDRRQTSSGWTDDVQQPVLRIFIDAVWCTELVLVHSVQP